MTSHFDLSSKLGFFEKTEKKIALFLFCDRTRKMKLLLFLLLLAICHESNSEPYNYLGKYSHESLSQKKCTAVFHGKSVLAALKTALTRISDLKDSFAYKPTVDVSKELFSRLDWEIQPSEVNAWTLGRHPYVVVGKTKNIRSTCAQSGGILPMPSVAELPLLEKLLKRANLSVQILDVSLHGDDLVYPNGVVASTLSSTLYDGSGNAKTDAATTFVTYSGGTYRVDPTTKVVGRVPVAQLEILTKGLCMVLLNRFSKYLQVPYDYTVNNNRIINKLNMLYSRVDQFSDRIKLSVLDLTSENKEGDYSGYPIIIGQLFEFFAIGKSCFNLGQCSLFDEQILNKLDFLLESIALVSTKIEQNFLQTSQGTCVISNSLKLACICVDENQPYEVVLFEPTPVHGKMLAFDHYIQIPQSSTTLETSCLYKNGRSYSVLSDKCCNYLRLVEDEAVNYCPVIFMNNVSPFVLDHQLMRLDAADRVSVKTTCEMNNNLDLAQSDSLKLSDCNVDLLTKLGSFVLKSFGNFNHDKRMTTVTSAAPTPVTEIALYSVCGIVILLLSAILLVCVLYFRPNARNFCRCLKKREILEPIGPEIVELHPLEERSLRLKPTITYEGRRRE